MTHVLDTDHVSILQRQRGAEFITLTIRIAEHDPEQLGLSVVSLHEQTIGCHAYINRARTSDQVVRGYAMLVRVLRAFALSPVLPYDEAAAAIYDDLVLQKTGVATMDLRLAATVLSRNLILVTRNRRDFVRVPGLMIEDWTR